MTDARYVSCGSCGAPCAIAQEKTVICAHCGATVDVPADVRFFAGHVDLLAGAGHWKARVLQLRALRGGRPIPREEDVSGPDVPVLDATCPSCGHPMAWSESKKERCPACGVESVPKISQSVPLIVEQLAERSRMRKLMEAEMLAMYPIAIERGVGHRCARCNVPLRSTGVDPAGGSMFERCECGDQNTGSMARTMLLAYADLGAAMTKRGEEALAGDARRSAAKLMAPIALVFAAVVIIAAVGVARRAEPSHEPRPAPTFTFVMPARLPEFTTYPSDVACPLESACMEGEIARACNDAGVVEDTHCVLLGMRCARDRCGPGARCCFASLRDE